MPFVAEVQARLVFWGDGPNVRLDGLIGVQVRPVEVAAVSPIVPVNPLSPVRVKFAFSEKLGSSGAGEKAAIVKSVKLNVAVVWWLRVLFVPVIVTM